MRAHEDVSVRVPTHDGDVRIFEAVDEDGGTWICIVPSPGRGNITLSRARARRIAFLINALAAKEYDGEEEES